MSAFVSRPSFLPWIQTIICVCRGMMDMLSKMCPIIDIPPPPLTVAWKKGSSSTGGLRADAGVCSDGESVQPPTCQSCFRCLPPPLLAPSPLLRCVEGVCVLGLRFCFSVDSCVSASVMSAGNLDSSCYTAWLSGPRLQCLTSS